MSPTDKLVWVHSSRSRKHKLGVNTTTCGVSRSYERLHFCDVLKQFLRTALPVILLALDSILMLRIFALYDRSKKSKFYL